MVFGVEGLFEEVGGGGVGLGGFFVLFFWGAAVAHCVRIGTRTHTKHLAGKWGAVAPAARAARRRPPPPPLDAPPGAAAELSRALASAHHGPPAFCTARAFQITTLVVSLP